MESLGEAVDAALDEMPEDFLIRKYLIENRGAVRMSILTEYDAERHVRLVDKLAREEGREEGRAEGREEGRKEGRKEGQAELNALYIWLIEAGRLEELKRLMKDPVLQEQLFEEFRRNGKAQVSG